MPIKITCKCGQGFMVKERLAGKTFECPKCGARLKIPQPESAGQPKPVGQPTQPKQRQHPGPKPKQPGPKQAQPPKASDPMADLLDEAGLDGATPPNVCPGCRTVMPQQAVLCINCGYNKKLGRKVETQTASATPLAAGRAAAEPGGRPGALKLVATGLTLVLAGIVLSCLLVLVWLASSRLPALARIAGILPRAMIVAYLLGIVGRFLCLNVPKQARAEGLIIAALVLEVAALLMPFLLPTLLSTAAASVAEGTMGGAGAGLGPPSPGADAASLFGAILGALFGLLLGSLLGPLLSFAAMIVFLFFLKRLGEYFKRSNLAEGAQSVINMAFGLVGVLVATFILPIVAVKASLALGALLALLMVLGSLVFAIILLILYIRLLLGVRQAVLSRSR